MIMVVNGCDGSLRTPLKIGGIKEIQNFADSIGTRIDNGTIQSRESSLDLMKSD